MKSLIVANKFAKKIRAKCPYMGYSEAFSTGMMLSSCKTSDRNIIEVLLDTPTCKLSEIITAYAQGGISKLWEQKINGAKSRPWLHDVKIVDGRLGKLPPTLSDSTLHALVCSYIKSANLDDYKPSDVVCVDQGDIIKMLFDLADAIGKNVALWKGEQADYATAYSGAKQIFHAGPQAVDVCAGGADPDPRELKKLVRLAAEAMVAVMGNPGPETHVFLPAVNAQVRGNINAVSTSVRSDSVDGICGIVDYLQEVLHLYFSSIRKK